MKVFEYTGSYKNFIRLPITREEILLQSGKLYVCRDSRLYKHYEAIPGMVEYLQTKQVDPAATIDSDCGKSELEPDSESSAAQKQPKKKRKYSKKKKD